MASKVSGVRSVERNETEINTGTTDAFNSMKGGMQKTEEYGEGLLHACNTSHTVLNQQILPQISFWNVLNDVGFTTEACKQHNNNMLKLP